MSLFLQCLMLREPKLKKKKTYIFSCILLLLFHLREIIDHCSCDQMTNLSDPKQEEQLKLDSTSKSS